MFTHLKISVFCSREFIKKFFENTFLNNSCYTEYQILTTRVEQIPTLSAEKDNDMSQVHDQQSCMLPSIFGTVIILKIRVERGGKRRSHLSSMQCQPS